MSANRTSTDPIHPRNRTKVGNGTRVLSKIDYRSVLGRRFRELVEDYEHEFEAPTKFDCDLIKIAAGLVITNEAMTEAAIRGERVDPDAVIKMAGQLKRVLGGLKRRAAASSPNASAPMSLLDHYQLDDDHEGAEEEA